MSDVGPQPFDVLVADFVAAAAEAEQLPPPALAEVAFAGRSNVGKSSMLNAVMQRKGLVRTSRTPGATRSVNIFHAATRNGLDLHLVDLPGYGFAKRSKDERKKWGPLLEGYLQQRQTLRAVMVLVDARRGIEDDDMQLLDFCAAPRPGNAALTTYVIATKIDLIAKAKRKPTLSAIQEVCKRRVIGFSAETHEGRLDIWKVIDRQIRGPETT